METGVNNGEFTKPATSVENTQDESLTTGDGDFSMDLSEMMETSDLIFDPEDKKSGPPPLPKSTSISGAHESLPDLNKLQEKKRKQEEEKKAKLRASLPTLSPVKKKVTPPPIPKRAPVITRPPEVGSGAVPKIEKPQESGSDEVAEALQATLAETKAQAAAELAKEKQKAFEKNFGETKRIDGMDFYAFKPLEIAGDVSQDNNELLKYLESMELGEAGVFMDFDKGILVFDEKNVDSKDQKTPQRHIFTFDSTVAAGEGGFGTVYKATDIKNPEQSIVIKKTKDGTNPEVLQNFHTEGKIMETLSDVDGVPDVYAHFGAQKAEGMSTTRDYFIASEYIAHDSQDVSEKIRERAVAEFLENSAIFEQVEKDKKEYAAFTNFEDKKIALKKLKAEADTFEKDSPEREALKEKIRPLRHEVIFIAAELREIEDRAIADTAVKNPELAQFLLDLQQVWDVKKDIDRKGIATRDWKPDNVRINDAGKMYAIDMGGGIEFGKRLKENKDVMTVDYMDPAHIRQLQVSSDESNPLNHVTFDARMEDRATSLTTYNIRAQALDMPPYPSVKPQVLELGINEAGEFNISAPAMAMMWFERDFAANNYVAAQLARIEGSDGRQMMPDALARVKMIGERPSDLLEDIEKSARAALADGSGSAEDVANQSLFGVRPDNETLKAAEATFSKNLLEDVDGQIKFKRAVRFISEHPKQFFKTLDAYLEDRKNNPQNTDGYFTFPPPTNAFDMVMNPPKGIKTFAEMKAANNSDQKVTEAAE